MLEMKESIERKIIRMKFYRATFLGALASLIAGSAWAADLASAPRTYTKAPLQPVQMYDWTGFYVGGHAGYDWTNSTDVVTHGNDASLGFLIPGEVYSPLALNPKGFMGGGQFGYNWQASPLWVVGLEADISWANLASTKVALGTVDPTRITTARERLDWFGTVRGRLGITPSDRVLLYMTGGLAYARANLSTARTRQGDPATPPNGCGGLDNCQSGSVSDTRFGWTVGAGVEWAFANNWSVKGEYLYYQLGALSHAMTDPVFAPTFSASAELKGNIARVGVNYRFGGPVVAKY